MNNVITEQNGKIDRQKKYIAELEGRNAKLLQKPVAPLPSKPVENKVDSHVVNLNKIIKDQAGRIDRQKSQLSNLEKQYLKLKKEAIPQPGRGSQAKKGHAATTQGPISMKQQGRDKRDIKPTLGDKIATPSGPAQRQLPPHLDLERDGEAGPSRDHGVDPNFARSVENLIASMRVANQKIGKDAGPSTGPDTLAPRSRTGSNRIAVEGQSLWNRLGRQRAEDEEVVSNILKLDQGQGVKEEQDQVLRENQEYDQGRGLKQERDKRPEVKQEQDHEEGVPLISLGEKKRVPTKSDDGWGQTYPADDRKDAGPLSQDSERADGGGGDVHVHSHPEVEEGQIGQVAEYKWGDEGGEEWDQYHSQSVQCQPGAFC